MVLVLLVESGPDSRDSRFYCAPCCAKSGRAEPIPRSGLTTDIDDASRHAFGPDHNDDSFEVRKIGSVRELETELEVCRKGVDMGHPEVFANRLHSIFASHAGGIVECIRDEKDADAFELFVNGIPSKKDRKDLRSRFRSMCKHLGRASEDAAYLERRAGELLVRK